MSREPVMPPSEQAAPAPLALRLAALLVHYSVATLLGGLVFVGLIRLGVAFFGPGVMFYRGVAALAGAGLILLVVLGLALSRLPPRFGLSAPDALGGAIVATCLLMAAFVLGPVTVDRSVSVFMLSRFERADHALTKEEARAAFVNTYVGEWDQIGRRLKEQELSGNLVETPQGWRLTPQGRRFMEVARFMSALFDGDPRFVGRAN